MTNSRQLIRFVLAMALIACVADGMAETAAAQQKPTPPTVEVFGLEVRKPIAPLEDPLWRILDEPSDNTRVSIDLLVTFKDQVVIELDKKTTRFTQFVDDKGTDFGKAKVPDSLVRSYARFSKDGRVALKMRSAHLPALGATKIVLKGQLGCELGRDLQTAEWTRASKKKGDFYKIGPFDFFFKEDEDDCVLIGPNSIKRVSFFDKKDRPLKTNLRAGSNLRPTFDLSGGNIVGPGFDKTWHFAFGADYAKVKVEYYAAMETAVVPIDLEITLGI